MSFPYIKDKITWWLPNKACYKHWFSGAGFKWSWRWENIEIPTRPGAWPSGHYC